MPKESNYRISLSWKGNTIKNYDRAFTLTAPEKPPIQGSSDPLFKGDAARWNPEEMLIASISSCHMLSYLHLCFKAGIMISEYHDNPTGVLTLSEGNGRMTKVVLNPEIKLTDVSRLDEARELHATAHDHCFIANSVKIPIEINPDIIVSIPTP